MKTIQGMGIAAIAAGAIAGYQVTIRPVGATRPSAATAQSQPATPDDLVGGLLKAVDAPGSQVIVRTPNTKGDSVSLSKPQKKTLSQILHTTSGKIQFHRRGDPDSPDYSKRPDVPMPEYSIDIRPPARAHAPKENAQRGGDGYQILAWNKIAPFPVITFEWDYALTGPATAPLFEFLDKIKR